MFNQHISQFEGLSINIMLVLRITLVTLLISGCVPRTRVDQIQPTGPPALSHGDEIGGYVELVDALRAQNATVESLGEIYQDFFDVQGQVITVNGAEVQVFEFSDEAAREASAGQISPDGSSIGTTMITWIDQPNFWAKGRVVVLYIGQDTSTIELLTAVLGEPIVQGQPALVQNNLADTKWDLLSFGWPGAYTEVEVTPVISGSTITLEFGTEGQAGGSGGCNSYSTHYEVQGNKLSTGQIIRTLIACEASGVDQQEQRYFRALETARQFEQAADHLVIWYGDGQDVLFFIPWRKSNGIPTAISTPCATPQPTSTTTPVANLPSPSPERVALETGAISAMRSGTLPVGGVKEYVLCAAASQVMHVQTVSNKAPIEFTLIGPSGETWTSEPQASNVYIFTAEVILPQDGDYVVRLIVPPGTGDTRYEISFTIETGSPFSIPLPTELTEPVNFAPGATSAQRSGMLPSGTALKQYALAGKAGQTLTVDISTEDAPLSVTFTSPSGMSGYRTEHRFVLDESGVYIVTIAKSGKTPSAYYTVVFTLQ